MSIAHDLGIQLRPHKDNPAPAGPRHDKLHMAKGLTYCWCMCPRCWLKYGGGGGICCCRQCPCQAAYKATLPVIPPRSPQCR